jgi:hypothetical protein
MQRRKVNTVRAKNLPPSQRRNNVKPKYYSPTVMWFTRRAATIGVWARHAVPLQSHRPCCGRLRTGTACRAPTNPSAVPLYTQPPAIRLSTPVEATPVALLDGLAIRIWLGRIRNSRRVGISIPIRRRDFLGYLGRVARWAR